MNKNLEEENNKILKLLSSYDDFNMSVYDINLDEDQNYVMYIIVNSSLKMGKGKLAAQVGHGVHKMAQYCLEHKKDLWNKYVNSNIPKIVLKTKSQEQLLEVIDKTKNIFKSYVIDEGRTQIAKNSLTVVSYEPMLKENVPDVIKELKLL
jgi:peptidyl-tRNA hydrolase, PTH2 family